MSAVPPNAYTGWSTSAQQQQSRARLPPAPFFGRKWSIIATSSTEPGKGDGAVLSQSQTGLDLRCTFQIQAADVQTPSIAIVTIYNLKDETMLKAVKEYQSIIVQAGYEHGPYGVVFQGSTKQYIRGHENQTETFLRIFIADWDLAYKNTTVDHLFDAGWTPQQVQSELNNRWSQNGVQIGYKDPLAGGVVPAPRGKVQWGQAVAAQNLQAASTNQTWTVQNGKLQLMTADRSTNLPLPPIKINSQTGMVSWPLATTQGIEFTCLINPGLKVGGLVEINNKSIQQVNAPGGATNITQFPAYAAPPQFYALAGKDDGLYRILVIEYDGDTRGNNWYAHVTCLLTDATASK